MTHLTEAAQLAWFNLDGVWERSAELVENVVDELKKLGPPKG
jgi:hypothetical protein